MLKTWTGVFAVLLSLAACAPMPVADSRNVRIESTPGMSVIYLVRSERDMSFVGMPVFIDERLVGPTYAGSYYRIELPAGRHRFSGYAHDAGTVTLDTQANGVYFVEHRVRGIYSRQPALDSSYRIVDEARARTVMADAQRVD
jgi:hypothetical protein